MKIHCPVIAVAVIVTTLPLNSGIDISFVQKVASCDKSSLRRSQADLRTSDVNENELGGLIVALDQENKDEHNDFQDEKIEKFDETVEEGTTMAEHFTAKAASKVATINALSVDVAKIKKTWRGSFEKSKVSAQVGNLHTSQNFSDLKWDELNSSQAEVEEDLTKEATAKLETVTGERLTHSAPFAFNPSSVNVANTQDTFNDVVKDVELNPQKNSSSSAFEKLDEETWNGHDNSQFNEEEELDEAAKDDMTEKRTTGNETAESETAPSKIAVFNSSSIIAANTQKAPRAVTKEEDFEAQKDGSSSLPENLDEETWGEHDSSHSNEAEEPDESAEDEMAEEETGNDKLLTAIAENAAFNSSSVNVADTQNASRSITTKGDLNAQKDGSNSAAENVDEEAWDESNNEEEELDEAAKDEIAQEEMAEKKTKKDDLLATIAPPKITVLNSSSVHVADTLDTSKGAIKEAELNASKDGLNSAAEDFDEEPRDEINNVQFDEEEELDEAAKEERVEEETIEEKTAEDELLTTNAPSEIAIFDSPPVDVAETQDTMRSETKDGEVGAQNLTGGLMIIPPATPTPTGSTNGKEAEEESEEENRDEEAKSSAAQSGNEEESEPEIEEDSTDEEAKHGEEDVSEDDSSDD